MEISANDWTAAKGLLVLLAQALSPTEGEMGAPIGLSGASSIAERVFNKPFIPTTDRFLHTVRLLPTLREAQNQMAHWIEVLASEAKNPGARVSPGTHSEVLPARPQTPNQTPSFKQASANEAEQLSSRAKNLILQVRSAIQTLSSSRFLINPQSEPLRNILAKLKPLVDEYIEALSKSGLDSQQEGSYNPFKQQPVLKSAREQALYKQGVPLSILQASGKAAPKTDAPLKSVRTESGRQIQEERLATTTGERVLSKGKEDSTKFSRLDGKKQIPEPPTSKRTLLEEKEATAPAYPAKRETPAPHTLPFGPRSSPLSRSEPKAEEAKKRSVQERSLLPNAFPAIFPLTLAVAKKKKKKRFLFQNGEESDSDRPHS